MWVVSYPAVLKNQKNIWYVASYCVRGPIPDYDKYYYLSSISGFDHRKTFTYFNKVHWDEEFMNL